MEFTSDSTTATATGVLTVLSFLFFFYFLWSKAAKKANSNSHKSPPEAGGAWPIIGHVQLMGRGFSSQLPHITLAAMAEKYGSIFTVKFGVNRALIVDDWDLVKEIFTTHDVAVSDRPKFIASKHLGFDFAMFGFSPYGPYWSQMRKLISIELLSSRRVQMQQHLYTSETRESMNKLYRRWEEKKDKSGRVLVELQKWYGDLNLNVILQMVAGKRYFGGREDEEETRRCLRVMRDFFHLTGQIIPADCLPWLRWLDIGGYEKKMKKAAKELDDLVEKWLDEHKVQNDDHSDKSKTQDFMDVMLSVVRGDDPILKDYYDPDTIIKSTCAVLIAGAADTISVMLVWALSLLLNNRRVLQKAQEELDIQIGKDRRVNESDINNLMYLRAIVKETFRLYPVGPLGGLREFTKDCVVGGYHVPKGTWLMVHMWKMQRNPSIWKDDPLEFKPERFLTTDKNVDMNWQDFELIPFGAGRRICPGIHLGTEMMLFILASLLHGFEIWTPGEELVDMAEIAGMTNSKATPLDVLLSPRLSPTLYN